MPSILILIPSFDNKHIYAKFQRREREECQGVYLKEDNGPLKREQ